MTYKKEALELVGVVLGLGAIAAYVFGVWSPLIAAVYLGLFDLMSPLEAIASMAFLFGVGFAVGEAVVSMFSIN